MSVRFDLDKPEERRAWEYLRSVSGSKNKAVIDALNANSGIADIIRQTIQECLQGVVPSTPAAALRQITDEENDLLDTLNSFMG